MPTYDYVCKGCKHKWELFQSMKDAPVRKCPACGKLKAERQFGVGAAVIFKGSGFYQTDYRSESYKQAAAADSKAAETPPATVAETAPAKGAADSSGKPADTAKTSESTKSAETTKPAVEKPITAKADVGTASKSAAKAGSSSVRAPAKTASKKPASRKK